MCVINLSKQKKRSWNWKRNWLCNALPTSPKSFTNLLAKWNFFVISFPHTRSIHKQHFSNVFHISFHFCIRNFAFFRFLWFIRQVASLDIRNCNGHFETKWMGLKEIKRNYFVTADFLLFESHFHVISLSLSSFFFRFIYSKKKVHAHIHAVSVMKLKFFPLLLKSFEKWFIRSWSFWVWEPFLLLFTLSMRINI